MSDYKIVGDELAVTLGFAHNHSQHSLESFLAAPVHGLVGVREGGADWIGEGTRIRLFFYDFLPLVAWEDDIRAKPNRFDVPSAVDFAFRSETYGLHFVLVGQELFEIPLGDFKALYTASCIRVVDTPKETQLFYL